MPVSSPLDSIQSLSLRLTIKVDGAAVNDAYGITSVQITHAINKISVADIVLQGEVLIASDSIPLSDGDDFKPGKDLEITAGYGDSGETSIFTGVIVKHGIEIDVTNGYNFRIIAKHKAVSMTFNQKEATFATKTDDAIIKAVVGTYGLSCTVDSASMSHDFVYQRMSSDWDFILGRAEFNGFVIVPDGADLKITKPALDATAVLRIAVGDSLISFSGEINAENQPTSIEAYAWDSQTLALITSTAAEPSVNSQGSLTAKTMSGSLSQTALKLISPTPMTTDELKTWSEGILLRKRLSAFKGSVKFVGNATVKPGTLIELEGVGKKFNGSAYVSSVTHVLDDESWSTTVKFGLDSSFINRKADYSYTPATGQVPAIHGLQIATVTKLSGDPKGMNRLEITLASNAESPAKVWARFANFYATGDAGSGFVPEVGDEVVVGFFDNDPRYPVIIGSLYSEKNKSPNAPADENNYIKSITTKTKMKLTMDDEKKVIKIETPGGNMITISDDDKSIELKDQNSNSIKMSSSGIDLTSAKDINIKATGGITLDATQKVTITAKQDVAITGMNVTATANMGFTAKGSATAEISASGQTTVKGAIVMIN